MRDFTEVFVIIAIFKPNPDFLSAQIKSISNQSEPPKQVVAVVADGQSAALTRSLFEAENLKFEIVQPDDQTSSYKSFEIGLSRALEIAGEQSVFAFSDQDDVWHKDKLATLRKTLEVERVDLAYSDARVIDAKGGLKHSSLHRLERRRSNAGLRDLLLKNSVTGMTILFSRSLAETALPFPTQAALFFHHDLWLAMVAGGLRGSAFVSRPLVDYRQHGANVVGALEAPKASPRFGSSAWRRHWVGRYAIASYLAKSLYLRLSGRENLAQSDISRAGLRRLSPYLSRRALGLRLMLDSVGHAAFGRFSAARDSIHFAAVQVGRLVWGLQTSVRPGLIAALTDFDRRMFAHAPGVQPGYPAELGSDRPTDRNSSQIWRSDQFYEKRLSQPFDIVTDAHRQPGLIVLVPTLNPSEIFAGIATALDIGLGVAARGYPVTFVATDLPIADERGTRAFLRGRLGVQDSAEHAPIELVCGQSESNLVVAPDDKILATAWWTAHVAQGMLDLGLFEADRFYYLIQDYEPGFYPWGSEYAGAEASYHLDFKPIFNTNLLAEYCRGQGLPIAIDPRFVFHPSIDMCRYSRLKRQESEVRKLAVYGRPEVARNLFPTAVEAVERFLIAADVAPDQIDLVSVGLAHPDVTFDTGHRMRSLGKIPWDDYPRFLASVDIGLSLMLSPHPSHLPLEMAAAGARVVTNSFGPKDLGQLSASIHSIPPTPVEVSRALCGAWDAGPVPAGDRDFSLETLGRPLTQISEELVRDLTGSLVSLAHAG